MPEIILQDEEWSRLITRQPSYVLDEHGIVQHAALAERLRQAGFDPEKPMHCEYDGATVTLTFRVSATSRRCAPARRGDRAGVIDTRNANFRAV